MGRSPDRDANLTLRVGRASLDALDRLAQARGLSKAELVRPLLERALDAWRAGEEPPQEPPQLPPTIETARALRALEARQDEQERRLEREQLRARLLEHVRRLARGRGQGALVREVRAALPGVPRDLVDELLLELAAEGMVELGRSPGGGAEPSALLRPDGSAVAYVSLR